MIEQPAAASQPTAADRPQMPGSYEVPATPPDPTRFGWPQVSAQLAAARNYWLCSTYPDGRPHAMPVWGVWLGGALYFGADPASRKGKNLAANPNLVVHLESGDNVVILEGVVASLAGAALPADYATEYERKYSFRPDSSDPDTRTFCLRPLKVLSWLESDFHASATRWHFGAQAAGEAVASRLGRLRCRVGRRKQVRPPQVRQLASQPFPALPLLWYNSRACRTAALGQPHAGSVARPRKGEAWPRQSWSRWEATRSRAARKRASLVSSYTTFRRA